MKHFLVVINGITLLTFLFLAATGIIPWLSGKALSGYLLLIHVMVAGVFMVFCTTHIVFHVYTVLQNERFPLLLRLCFWAMVVLMIPLILSVVSNMVPLWSTGWQEALVQTHRISALLFLAAGSGYSLLLFLITKSEAAKSN